MFMQIGRIATWQHTNNSSYPGCAQNSLKVLFFVNMMDGEKTAGCCVDDARSQQSFNLSFSIVPAECFVPPAPSDSHIVLLSLHS